MTTPALAFELPHSLEATEPPEARGAERDAVRLMVAQAATDRITHAAFSELSEFLSAGDLVVVMSNGSFGGIHHKLLQALA